MINRQASIGVDCAISKESFMWEIDGLYSLYKQKCWKEIFLFLFQIKDVIRLFRIVLPKFEPQVRPRLMFLFLLPFLL